MVGPVVPADSTIYATFTAARAVRKPFVRIPPVNARPRPLIAAWVVVGAVLLAGAILASPAAAVTPQEARAVADRASIAWSQRQAANGELIDYVSKRPSGGYGNVLTGYGMLRAGVRRGDDRLVAAGLRAVRAGLAKDPGERGVFDTLATSLSYSIARSELADNPDFRALRPRWESYLETIGKPFIESPSLGACTADPGCFHNHEAVGVFGDLELAGTGLRSTAAGAKLADPAALRSTAVRLLTEEIAGAAAREGRASRGVMRTGLGLLSDTGSWPLAYHDFSSAMLAGSVDMLGDEAPEPARDALQRAVATLAGYIAPDGDVSYLGRRQEQGWTLAATVYAATVASREAPDPRAAAEARAVADRAFARLTTAHDHGPTRLGPVPRELKDAASYRGLDATAVVSESLEIFMLNLAADAAEGAPALKESELPADADGSFIEPRRPGFATVRHGDLWYAVHRRTDGFDLRYDFGLVSLKRRGTDGTWRDLVRPRPNTPGPGQDSAGPVIVAGGQRYLPRGNRISVRPGGVVLVRGGWRSPAGAWLRRGVTFRFAPVDGGVALSFPLQAGDAARITTFLPRGSARRRGADSVTDARSIASVSLRPRKVRLAGGFHSCCDEELVGATMELRPRAAREVVYTVRDRSRVAPSEGGTRERRGNGGGGLSGTAIAGGVAVLLLLALALAMRARRRTLARRRAEARRRRRVG
jgi:hypothetical protein